jgi:FMN phosphatase YigB (HAD superfamily)
MDLGMPLEEISHRLIEVAEIDAPAESVLDAAGDMFWTNPDVTDALPFVQADLLIGSNTNWAHVRWFESEFSSILAPIKKRLYSCEIRAAKPSVAFWEALVQRAGCGPDEIVFVDDRADNVEASRMFGIDSILYDHTKTPFARELEKRGIRVSS